MCGANNVSILEREQRHLTGVSRESLTAVTGGSRLDSMLRAGTEEATLAWLEGALEHAYSHGQHLALAYLEAVIEDVLFEQEMAVRRTSRVDSAAAPASHLAS